MVFRTDIRAFGHAAWPYALFILLAALMVAVTAADGSWPLTHEHFRYPAVAEHFGRAFAEGQWWPRWLPEINGGYGYPTFVFYQPLVFFLWLPSRLVTGEAVSAMWFTIALILAGGASACYRLAACRGSRLLGLLGAVLFLLSPYVYVNWLARGDLSELLAMSLVPWALSFLQRLNHAWPRGERVAGSLTGFALATAGVFLAHPITGLLFGPALAIIALALTVGRRCDWALLLRLALAGFAAVLIATPYWQPLVSMQSAVNLKAAAGGYFDPTLHTLHWHQLFGGPWGFAGSLAASDKDQMSFQLGSLQLAVALTGAVVGWSSRFVRGVAIALLISVVAMTTTATALWRLPVFAQMQFPWRLLSVIVGLQAALLVGWAQNPPALLATSPKRAAALVALLVLAAGWRPEQFSLRARKPDAKAAVAALVATAASSHEPFAARNEFLPLTARRPPPVPRGAGPLVEAPAGIAVSPLPGHDAHHIQVRVNVPGTVAATPVVLTVNQLYFPGWSVFVQDQKVSRDELERSLHDDGRLRIPLPSSTGGSLTVSARYGGPPGAPLRFAAVFLGVAILVGLRKLDRHRSNRFAPAGIEPADQVRPATASSA